MADFVLRATPDMLNEYKQGLEEVSITLRSSLDQIHVLMNKMNASVESPAMSESNDRVESEIQSCKLLVRELEHLSEYADEMIGIYKEAESNFIERLRSEFGRTEQEPCIQKINDTQ